MAYIPAIGPRTAKFAHCVHPTVTVFTSTFFIYPGSTCFVFKGLVDFAVLTSDATLWHLQGREVNALCPDSISFVVPSQRTHFRSVLRSPFQLTFLLAQSA